jgi:hypothetical protein
LIITHQMSTLTRLDAGSADPPARRWRARRGWRTAH